MLLAYLFKAESRKLNAKNATASQIKVPDKTTDPHTDSYPQEKLKADIEASEAKVDVVEAAKVPSISNSLESATSESERPPSYQDIITTAEDKIVDN